LLGRVDDGRARGDIPCVRNSRAKSCAFLNDHFVAGGYEYFNATRDNGNTILAVLDFLWNSDQHL
jgi:hypothetical protein